MSTITTTTTPSPPSLTSDFTSPRARRQLTLYLTGSAFFTLSTLLTRRAIHRQHLWPTPKFYTPSNQPPPAIELNTGVMALQALQLATVNVMAFMLMVGGGAGWAWDVQGWREVREIVRRRRRKGGREEREGEGGRGEEELEGLGLGELVRGVVGGGEDGVVERAREKRRRVERERMQGIHEEDQRRKKETENSRTEEPSIVIPQDASKQDSRPWWKPW